MKRCFGRAEEEGDGTLGHEVEHLHLVPVCLRPLLVGVALQPGLVGCLGPNYSLTEGSEVLHVPVAVGPHQLNHDLSKAKGGPVGLGGLRVEGSRSRPVLLLKNVACGEEEEIVVGFGLD